VDVMLMMAAERMNTDNIPSMVRLISFYHV